MNNTVKLIISITIPLMVGFTSGLFTTTGAGSWYQDIQRPSWNPPNWIFAPVWTTLYVMMGISWFLIWRSDVKRSSKRTTALFFIGQLILNFSWSVIFFYFHQPGWAFVEIIILWLMILGTILSFSKISKLAAWLLVPYISWVSFATILTYTIWRMNS